MLSDGGAAGVDGNSFHVRNLQKLDTFDGDRTYEDCKGFLGSRMTKPAAIILRALSVLLEKSI